MIIRWRRLVARVLFRLAEWVDVPEPQAPGPDPIMVRAMAQPQRWEIRKGKLIEVRDNQLEE